MNITELRQERDVRKERLSLAYGMAEVADRKLQLIEPGTDEHVATLNAKALASTAILNAERELATISDALHQMEEVDKAGHPIEAIESSTVDTIRYATLVVGIGYDPDDPEQLFAQTAVRTGKSPVCSFEVARILRQLADHLEAKHSHNEDGH